MQQGACTELAGCCMEDEANTLDKSKECMTQEEGKSENKHSHRKQEVLCDGVHRGSGALRVLL